MATRTMISSKQNHRSAFDARLTLCDTFIMGFAFLAFIAVVLRWSGVPRESLGCFIRIYWGVAIGLALLATLIVIYRDRLAYRAANDPSWLTISTYSVGTLLGMGAVAQLVPYASGGAMAWMLLVIAPAYWASRAYANRLIVRCPTRRSDTA
jgi:hypothetical protein